MGSHPTRHSREGGNPAPSPYERDNVLYCPRCHNHFDGDYISSFDLITCPACSHTALAGCWLTRNGEVVGDPSEVSAPFSA